MGYYNLKGKYMSNDIKHDCDKKKIYREFIKKLEGLKNPLWRNNTSNKIDDLILEYEMKLNG